MAETMQEHSHTFEQLETLIKKHYTNPDLDLLRRAYEMAQEAHKDEMRLTGEPFIVHPISVAYTLAEMGLHINVVVAGLLHDVVARQVREI